MEEFEELTKLDDADFSPEEKKEVNDRIEKV